MAAIQRVVGIRDSASATSCGSMKGRDMDTPDTVRRCQISMSDPNRWRTEESENLEEDFSIRKDQAASSRIVCLMNS
jgi:hypothetical protein